MRPCSAALADYLAAHDTFIVADLYTVALPTGEILRYSGWTTPLRIPGTLFPSVSHNYNALDYTDFALGPRFGRSKVATKIGVAPTELDIEILAGAADRIGTVSFADAIRLGLFDGATVELDRLFAPPQPDAPGGLDTSLGAIIWFHGRVAETDVGRTKIQMKSEVIDEFAGDPADAAPSLSGGLHACLRRPDVRLRPIDLGPDRRGPLWLDAIRDSHRPHPEPGDIVRPRHDGRAHRPERRPHPHDPPDDRRRRLSATRLALPGRARRQFSLPARLRPHHRHLPQHLQQPRALRRLPLHPAPRNCGLKS
jgi:hypothetical protein